MNWFAITLLGTLFFVISNYIDKYLLSKYFNEDGAGPLLAISAFIGIPLALGIIIFHSIDFKINLSIVGAIIGGMLYMGAAWSTLKAFQQNDVSLAVPLFQLIPVFVYTLSYMFLGEQLTIIQITGVVIVIGASIILQIRDVTLAKIVFNWKVFCFMALASFLYALNYVIFKVVSHVGLGEMDFWNIVFWEYVGFSCVAFVSLLFFSKIRLGLLNAYRRNKKEIIVTNAINEFVNIVGKLFLNLASLLAPIALVWAGNAFQGLFALILGVVLTIFFPKIIQEDISRSTLIKKIIPITFIIIGAVLINL